MRPFVVVALAVAVAAVAAAGGCSVDAPGPFGRPCVSAVDCDGLQCRAVSSSTDATRRCVPPRQPGEPGESCDNPVFAAPHDPESERGGAVIVDEILAFGGAVDDVDLCGGVDLPDLSLRFRLHDTRGLILNVEGGDGDDLAVGLRPVVDGACGSLVRFGCGTRQSESKGAAPAIVPVVPAGDYELVVDGRVADAGQVGEQGVRVTVTVINCPPGGVPLGDVSGAQCLAFEPRTPLLRARAGAGATVDGGGRVIIAGGVGRDGEARSDGEVIDDNGGVRFAEIDEPRAHPVLLPMNRSAFAVSGSSIEFVSLSTDAVQTPEPLGGEVVTAATWRGDAVAFSERGTTWIRALPRSCGLNACDGGRTCVEGRCVCVAGIDCEDFLDLAGAYLPGGVAAGARAVEVGEVVVVVEPAGVRAFGGGEEAEPRERRGFNGQGRRDAALVVRDPFVWVVGGTAEDGSLAFDVDRINTLTESVDTVGALPVPLARPQAALFGDLLVAVDQDALSDTPVVFDVSQGVVLPAPVAARGRSDIALAVDGSGVVFVGGADEEGRATPDVERLTIVEAGRTFVPPNPICSATHLLTLRADEGDISETVSGNTTGRADRFHDSVCFFDGLVGDEQWELILERPAGVRLVGDIRDGGFLRLTVSAGLCSEADPVVGCSTGETVLSGVLDLPSLPAGTWFVSVEGRDTFGEPSATYNLTATTRPPRDCEPDAGDPTDDTPAGAPLLRRNADGALRRTSSLCPGDVDHLAFAFIGSEDFSNVAVSNADDVTIATAEVVVDGTGPDGLSIVDVGPASPLAEWVYEGHEPGVYVARVAPPAGYLAPLSWELVYNAVCVPDDEDSLFPSLDDAARPADAPRLAPAGAVTLNLCFPAEHDLVVLAPASSGRPSRATISGFIGELRLFDFTGGSRGARLDVAFVEVGFNTFAVDLPAAAGPFLLELINVSEINYAVRVSFEQGPPGDTCDEPLALGRSGTEVIDSAVFADDANAIEVGDCTGYRSPGEDVFYAVTVGAGETLTATLTPTGDYDVALYLLRSCPAGDFADVCEVGQDLGNRAVAETLVFDNDGPAADYFLVVDSFFGESYAATLAWTIE